MGYAACTVPSLGRIILLYRSLSGTPPSPILYFRLIATAGATNAALVTFIIPISAILLGVVILGETFTPVQGLGMSLIGAGLIMMDGRLLKRR